MLLCAVLISATSEPSRPTARNPSARISMLLLSGGRDVELVAGPAEDPMIRTTGSMGRPPEYTTKDDHEWLRAHPMLRCDRGRQRGSGGGDGAGPPEVFALSLFGIAGVHSGKAGRMQVSVAAARGAAENTVERVVRPIQALGHQVRVFGHMWTELQNGTLLRSIEAAYAAAGVRAVLFETPMQTREHVASMAISMSFALRLARDAAAAEGTSFTQLMLMRHDTWWFAPFVLPPSACVGGALVVATWCEAPNLKAAQLKGSFTRRARGNDGEGGRRPRPNAVRSAAVHTLFGAA